MTNEGFYCSADEAIEFWERCVKDKIDTREGRIQLLRQMVKEKKVKYIPHPEEFIKGKNVISLKPEDKKNESNS